MCSTPEFFVFVFQYQLVICICICQFQYWPVKIISFTTATCWVSIRPTPQRHNTTKPHHSITTPPDNTRPHHSVTAVTWHRYYSITANESNSNNLCNKQTNTANIGTIKQTYTTNKLWQQIGKHECVAHNSTIWAYKHIKRSVFYLTYREPPLCFDFL